MFVIYSKNTPQGSGGITREGPAYCSPTQTWYAPLMCDVTVLVCDVTVLVCDVTVLVFDW